MLLCCNANCCGDYCPCCGKRLKPWVAQPPWVIPHVPVYPLPPAKFIPFPEPRRPWLTHLDLTR